MRLVLSMSDLEVVLLEEARKRLGLDPEGVVVIKASAGRALTENMADESSPVVILDLALPEAEAGAIVPDSKIKEVEGGTARGSAKGSRKRGGSKKKK